MFDAESPLDEPPYPPKGGDPLPTQSNTHTNELAHEHTQLSHHAYTILQIVSTRTSCHLVSSITSGALLTERQARISKETGMGSLHFVCLSHRVPPAEAIAKGTSSWACTRSACACVETILAASVDSQTMTAAFVGTDAVLTIRLARQTVCSATLCTHSKARSLGAAQLHVTRSNGHPSEVPTRCASATCAWTR